MRWRSGSPRSARRRAASSPTCPTTFPRRCCCAGWRRSAFASLTLMFQKEVADRLTATPRSKDYGRLSVLVQWLCEPRRLFDIPPRAFTPPPKVTSTVLQLTPRPRPLHPAEQGRPGARHGGRLRPAPQDAAAEPPGTHARRRRSARGRRHSGNRPRRGADRRTVLRSDAGMGGDGPIVAQVVRAMPLAQGRDEVMQADLALAAQAFGFAGSPAPGGRWPRCPCSR